MILKIIDFLHKHFARQISQLNVTTSSDWFTSLKNLNNFVVSFVASGRNLSAKGRENHRIGYQWKFPYKKSTLLVSPIRKSRKSVSHIGKSSSVSNKRKRERIWIFVREREFLPCTFYRCFGSCCVSAHPGERRIYRSGLAVACSVCRYLPTSCSPADARALRL